MLKLINPYVLLGALVGALLCWGAGYATGYSRADDAARLRETKNLNRALAQERREAARVLKDERGLRAADAAAHLKFYEETQREKHATDRLISDLRGDVKRLRVPVRYSCPAAAAAGGSAAPGPGQEGHAELTPDAGAFLVGLLARGDEGIRKHAEVVDRYERLRQACAGATPPQ